MPEHEFPASFDLGDPDIRFDVLAQSMGVAAVRVETPSRSARRSTRRSPTTGRS